ncbi:MAG: hypothetical protein KAG14_04655 [Mycoplasmataceae bacterium]|nr:hypothetical protein [Mycoplasmataceae bacterium]
MKYLCLIFLLLLSACGYTPEIIKGKGAVYGIISVDAHPDFKKKTLIIETSLSEYESDAGEGINYKKNMVNYPDINDLYVGLVSSNYSPQQHHLFITEETLLPPALALAPSDSLHIHNNTTSVQHFFMTNIHDDTGFQSFPELKVGESAVFTLKLEGHLELLSEDNPNLKMRLFSKKNMLSKRFSSGDRYQFENLNAGDYQLVFWYWRLGVIQQAVSVKAEENIHLDKTLTVKSVIRVD